MKVLGAQPVIPSEYLKPDYEYHAYYFCTPGFRENNTFYYYRGLLGTEKFEFALYLSDTSEAEHSNMIYAADCWKDFMRPVVEITKKEFMLAYAQHLGLV